MNTCIIRYLYFLSKVGVLLVPGTKVLARSASKIWFSANIIDEVKKERFLVVFSNTQQESVKQKYIVTRIEDVPKDGTIDPEAFSR